MKPIVVGIMWTYVLLWTSNLLDLYRVAPGAWTAPLALAVGALITVGLFRRTIRSAIADSPTIASAESSHTKTRAAH